MTAEQWSAVESIFAEICDLPAEERSVRLEAISDEVVRREIASLLEHAGATVPVTDAIRSMAASLHSLSGQPQRFGVYRVVRRLAQGGQGAVFEGIRDDGTFEQRVAIKIVNWEIDDEASRARLRQERQILAGLEHPNIARLLDGGETNSGTPYFVMEFVEGRPLTEGAAGWPQKRKLALFLEVLDAVAFAHRNLIVHRDLKPANILVTQEGMPKLLDFGIAKLIATDPLQTQTAFVPLSPGYASPEQVRSLPISTSSDVYSLGVVLFELLTGRRPYKLKTTNPVEIDQKVCQEPPESPGLGDDLDHIVLMALRKEPERRYDGVTRFADDIKRYLEHKPVHARPDTLWYRSRKYVQRHALGLLAAAITLTAICGGASIALLQARTAEQRFTQVRTLAHSFVFDYYDQLAQIEGTTALREKMVRTALEYVDNLVKNSGSDVGLQKELAASYRRVGDAQGFPGKPNLGHIDQATASYRKAAQLYDRVLAKDPGAKEEVGEFYSAFMALLTNAGDYASASKMGERALDLLNEAAQASPTSEGAQAELARAWNLLGDIDDDTDQPAAAYKKYEKAERITSDMLSHWHDEQALRTEESTVNRLAPAAQVMGRLKEAETEFMRDETTLQALLQLAPGNPGYHRSNQNLNQFWSQLYCDDLLPSFQDPGRSLPYAQRMLDLARRAVARDEHDAAAKFSLAIALYRISFPLKYSDPKAALEAARESVRLFDQQIAEGHSSFLVISRRARALLRLSEALLFAQHPREAASVATNALAQEEKVAEHDDPKIRVSTRMVLAVLAGASASEQVGDRKQAQAQLQRALEIAESIYSRDKAALLYAIPLARARLALADYWRRAGDRERAKHWREQLQDLWTQFPDQNEFVQQQRIRSASF